MDKQSTQPFPKLYEVPRGSRVRLPDNLEVLFHRVDGAYSYCTTDSGEVVHVAAWAEVEIVEEPKK